MAEPQLVWGMVYANDAQIVSRPRNNHAEVMAVVVAVRASFGSAVLEAKMETMYLMKTDDQTYGYKITVVAEAIGQVYKQTIKFCVPWGNCVRECWFFCRD